MFKTRSLDHGRMKAPAVVLLLLSASLVPSVFALEARAPPSCLDVDLSLIQNYGVDDGVCIIIELDGVSNGEVLDFEIEVSGDALDVMFFDSISIDTYLLGQNYLSHFESEPSTLSLLDTQSFHWQIPDLSSQKDWFIVVDNSMHDGDQAQGDQGGNRGLLTIDVSTTQDWYWTPYHNLLELPEGNHSDILHGNQLSLDVGTQVVVTAWQMQSEGDVLLQTSQNNADMKSGVPGDHHIPQAALKDVEGSESFTWTVDEDNANNELFLVVADDGEDGVDLKISIRVELIPPLNPVISSDKIVANLGQSIDFNSSQTPNGLGQISTYRWYLDGSGSAFSTNSLAEVECITPKQHDVELTVYSIDGRSASTNTSVTCRDVVNPTASIASLLQKDSQSRFLLGVGLAGELLSDSSDDHMISEFEWFVDGESMSTSNTLDLEWENIGEHVITLTVTDASGNSASIEKIVLVIDNTVPVIEESTLSIPTQGKAGEKLEFTAEAEDAFDDEAELTYNWDLNPEVDTNQDAIPDNDADLSGKKVSHSFDKPGDYTVVLTVSDAAGNSDRYVFQVTIEAAPDEGSILGILAIILLSIIATGLVAIFGERAWRTKQAESLLVANGLSEAEAKARVSGIKSSISFKPFTDAYTFAGMNTGEQILSTEQRAAIAKQEELDRLYGSGASDPYANESRQSSWAPKRVLATPIPDEALTDLMGHQDPVQEAAIVPGGVEIPEVEIDPVSSESGDDTPMSDVMRGECAACDTPFEFELPPDVAHAVIECPACSQEQLFER